MIPLNIIQRILFLKRGESTATGFTIEVGDKQYLITARHLFLNPGEEDYINLTLPETIQIDLFQNNGWHTVNLKTVNPKSTKTDIAIFAADHLLTNCENVSISDKYFYSQDAYFLGFPFGINAGNAHLNNLHPLPIIKGGIFSSIPSKEIDHMFFLDAINNFGFSGGPVVFRDPVDQVVKIAGIISGYKIENIPVQHEGQPTGLFIQGNSGLTVCYSAIDALNSITLNPIGFSLK